MTQKPLTTVNNMRFNTDYFGPQQTHFTFFIFRAINGSYSFGSTTTDLHDTNQNIAALREKISHY